MARHPTREGEAHGAPDGDSPGVFIRRLQARRDDRPGRPRPIDSTGRHALNPGREGEVRIITNVADGVAIAAARDEAVGLLEAHDDERRE